jgi:hypothetical protein
VGGFLPLLNLGNRFPPHTHKRVLLLFPPLPALLLAGCHQRKVEPYFSPSLASTPFPSSHSFICKVSSIHFFLLRCSMPDICLGKRSPPAALQVAKLRAMTSITMATLLSNNILKSLILPIKRLS